VSAAKLVALTYEALEGEQGLTKEIHEQRVLVRLRLNPEADVNNKVDHAANTALIKLGSELKGNRHEWNREQVEKALENVEHTIQKLLKQEWNVSKNEAIYGRVHRSKRN
jgi:hypothetical protein